MIIFSEINIKNLFSSNLKYLRLQKGFKTLKDFSVKCGVHSEILSTYELGKKFPNIKNLSKICIALEITPERLFYSRETAFLMEKIGQNKQKQGLDLADLLLQPTV